MADRKLIDLLLTLGAVKILLNVPLESGFQHCATQLHHVVVFAKRFNCKLQRLYGLGARALISVLRVLGSLS